MDGIAEWTRAQSRVIELVEGLSPDEAGRAVPACPDWTVRELLAHMVGLGADVVAGDEPDDHNPVWTQNQVDARAEHSVEALLAEWRSLTSPLQEWMQDNNTRPLGDVVIHEQDLRGALGRTGAHDTNGLRALRDRMADGLAARVAEAGLDGVELISPSWGFVAGARPAAVAIEASEFDLTRALMSRRSADQLRSWTTAGDIDAYLPLFAGLGPLPTGALTE